MPTKTSPQTRSRLSKKKQHWMGKVLRFGLPLLALMLAGALIYDAHRIAREAARGDDSASIEERIERDLQRISRGLENTPYIDPRKGFSMAVPHGWQMDPTGQGGFFDVTFRGPGSIELSALAEEVDYTEFAKLRRLIERKEMDIGLKMHIEEREFNDMPALYRTMRLETQRLHMIDFLAAGQAHHILFAAPHDLFDQYLPVMLEFMQTYTPRSE